MLERERSKEKDKTGESRECKGCEGEQRGRSTREVRSGGETRQNETE